MDLKDPFIFFTVLILANVFAYVLNIIISAIWDKSNKHKTVIHKKEILTSLFILLLNILIAIPGFLLWRAEIIIFSNTNFILSFIGLFLLMDLLMYVLHWLSHTLSILKKIHSKHHEHSEKFNPISFILYVALGVYIVWVITNYSSTFIFF